jgi:prevent-host-death family protein
MKKTVTTTELAERLTAVLEEVASNGEEIVITSDGRAFVKVVPVTDRPSRTLESLRRSGRILGDIEESTADEWDINR